MIDTASGTEVMELPQRKIDALGGSIEDVLDSNLQLGDENYLIVGTDTRAGLNSQVGAGSVDDAEGARADTVMLVNIPKDRSRVVVVSFPRDLDVTRPVCSAWDNDKGGYTDQKLPVFMGLRPATFRALRKRPKAGNSRRSWG